MVSSLLEFLIYVLIIIDVVCGHVLRSVCDDRLVEVAVEDAGDLSVGGVRACHS